SRSQTRRPSDQHTSHSQPWLPRRRPEESRGCEGASIRQAWTLLPLPDRVRKKLHLAYRSARLRLGDLPQYATLPLLGRTMPVMRRIGRASRTRRANDSRFRKLVRGTPERKTGVKHAEVITAWLIQDERGWLRLAG